MPTSPKSDNYFTRVNLVTGEVIDSKSGPLDPGLTEEEVKENIKDILSGDDKGHISIEADNWHWKCIPLRSILYVELVNTNMPF